MLQKIGLLLLIITSIPALAMSPVQFSQLQQQFKNALSQENLVQAQQIIGQLQSGGRGAYASAWQLELNAKKEAIEARKRAAADSVRAKADAERLAQQKKVADDEARKRDAQAREEKARRDQVEAQLKAEQAKGADNRAQLLNEVHTKNAQIDQLNTQISKLQQDIAAQKLNADTAALEAQGKCERDIAASAKKCEESTSALRSRYEQLLAEAQKAGQSSAAQDSQLQQLKAQVTQLQNELGQVNKQNENLKAGMPSQKANEELRLRLTDAEKALQAQTKKAQDCEQQKNELSAQLQTSGSNKARIDELSKKREELELRLKNLIESTNKEKQAYQTTQKQLEAAQKTEEALRKQIDEMKKNQGSFADQAQKSQIIQKKMDDLLTANQNYEKQVREQTIQLEKARKEIQDLTNEDNQKADRILILETDAEAEKKMKEKALTELASVQKEIRLIAKELKEQKEAYAAVQITGTEYSKKLKVAEEKCAAELAVAKNEYNKSMKEETAKIYKGVQEQLAKFKENSEAANRKANAEASAAKQSAVSFANSLMRQKEIKPKDIQDLIDILQAR